MRNRFYLPAFALLLALNACDKGENTETTADTITIAHELDTIQVPKNPSRIVALDYASVENLQELGIPIIGTSKSHLPEYLSALKTDEKIADLGTLFEVNYEKLNELNPEVIFISARMQSIYPELAEIAPTVFLQTDQSNILPSLKENLKVYGNLFDKTGEVTQAVTDIENQLAALNQKAKDSGKTALVLMYNNGKFSAFGKGSRFGIIHDLFGFREAVENLESARHGQAVSNEFIQKANPDYLFILDRGAVVDQKATDKASIENALIQQTNAYKNGKIVYLSPAWYISGDGITSLKLMMQEVDASL